MKKFCMQMAMILSFSVVMSCVVIPKKADAAYLSAYNSKTIQQGSKEKIILYSYWGNKRPKWSTSNKKIKIVNKGKTWAKIKGIKPGKAYVKCKIGKKIKKIKITVKPKSKVTHKNFNKISYGMKYEKVVSILGRYKNIEHHYTHTTQEYNQYLEWQAEEGGWEDEVYMNEIEYKWENPFENNTIYVTFRDGYVVDKKFY